MRHNISLWIFRSKFRTRTDILAQIIGVAKDKPVTKTRIAYDCFLSYDLLNDYLNALLASDLIGHDKKNNKYFATRKGLRYFELCGTLGKYANSNANSM